MATQPTPALADTGSPRMSLAARAWLAALVLLVEKFLLDFFVNFRAADAARGLGTVLRVAQHFGLRFAVSLVIALTVFIYVRSNETLRNVNAAARAIPVRSRWILVHAALIALLPFPLYNLYGGHGIELPFALLAASAVLLAGGAVMVLLAGLAPWSLWRRGAAAVGTRWGYAVLAALAATAAIVWSQALWAPTAQLTFGLVRWVLAPIIPTLQADPAIRVLRAPHFAVAVSRVCSGLEGIGLMVAFASAWLIYFRQEYRFPRALLLIPAGVLIVFSLNVLRIATLVLIGNAGHPAIAIFGFHSQAGWIAFNATACGLVLVSRRSRWLNRAADRNDSASGTNPTATYLLPFLVILAAGMLSHAVSGQFDTWYGLRLLAGGAVLAVCWPRLGGLDWHFSWRGIVIGTVAFALTLSVSRLFLAPHGMPVALAAMSPPARVLWIASRAATAIVLLPVAGELAYHGYLMRRLVASDFEEVPFRSIGWVPLLVAAVAYGVIHHALWLPAIGAGILYGAILIRTQRMGEAVAAHTAAALLLTATVLLGHQWQLW